MLYTCSQVRQIENDSFARGVDAGRLMESAGLAIAREIADFFPAPGHLVLFCGKGNNAGDILVAARELVARDWSYELDLAFPESELSPLAARNLVVLREVASPDKRDGGVCIALDGLLGIGASGAPREPVASAIRRINDLRKSRGAFVVAADIPSGLNGDTGIPADPCVTADLTVTIGLGKAGLVADSATNHVGRIALAPLPELIPTGTESLGLITPEILRPLLAPPDFDSHKGKWGHVGIIAGSRGLIGAARLCAEAALRAGAGLVTVYALPEGYSLLAATMPPEIMVKPVPNYRFVLTEKLDAIGIGPGLGTEHVESIREVVTRSPKPMVVDADALNILARHPYSWQKLGGPRLFTPHPGEMGRLWRDSVTLSRREAAEKYATQHRITLLLKGARTVIAHPGRPTVFNTTGNPGMGTGGMGDTLTGVCSALLARNFNTYQSAMLGAWLCGRAAEKYVFGPGGSPESLTAGEIPHHLGAAFRELTRG